MGFFPSRVVFAAFVGLSGFIIYNALYLQEVRPGARTLPGEGEIARESMPPVATAPAASHEVTGTAPPRQVQEASDALVTAVRRELSARGYDVGSTEGPVDERLSNAIAAYQVQHGLAKTGQPSDDLLRHIILGESVAELGETTGSAPAGANATIKEVQRSLADLGYAPGPIDGMMGSNTRKAILAFQKDRAIAETGQITPSLLQEIERVSGHAFTGGI